MKIFQISLHVNVIKVENTQNIEFEKSLAREQIVLIVVRCHGNIDFALANF